LLASDLAKVAKRFIPEPEFGRSSATEQANLSWESGERVRQMKPFRQHLDHTFQLPEAAAGDNRHACRLVGKDGILARKVNVGDLEEICIGIPVCLVMAANAQQTRHQALS
jgi:hypothetical protein